MQVSELIEILEQLPPEIAVRVYSEDDNQIDYSTPRIFVEWTDYDECIIVPEKYVAICPWFDDNNEVRAACKSAKQATQETL